MNNSREHQRIDLADGSCVSYAEYGDPEGRPMFLFHGWPCSRLQGRTGEVAAREYGYRLIVPDRPGIGDTTFHEERELSDWPQFLDKLTAALGIETFHLLAISGGAPYLYATAHAMPERIESATILCGAVPLALFPDRREMLLPYRVLLTAKKHAPWLLGAIIGSAGVIARSWFFRPLMISLYKLLPLADRRVVNNPSTRNSLMEGFQLAIQNGGQSVITDSEIYIAEWHFSLEEVIVPVTLWHGDLDHNIPPKMVAKVAEALPNAEIHWCEGEGHYSLSVNKVAEALASIP